MERRQLQPISLNTTRNRELNPSQRALILGCHQAGQKPVSIARDHNIPPSTVYSTIHLASRRAHQSSKPRSGRPKTVSDTTKQAIIRSIKKDPFASYSEIIEPLGLSICHRTLYTIIQGSGFGKWKAQKRPKLTQEIAKLRYDWALKHEDWTYDDWSKVVWSDECSIELGSGHQRKWVFRLNRLGEKWKKEYIQPYGKGKGIRVMVWASIWGPNRSDLVRLERDFESKKHGYTSKFYLALLEEMLSKIWGPGYSCRIMLPYIRAD